MLLMNDAVTGQNKSGYGVGAGYNYTTGSSTGSSSASNIVSTSSNSEDGGGFDYNNAIGALPGILGGIAGIIGAGKKPAPQTNYYGADGATPAPISPLFFIGGAVVLVLILVLVLKK